MANGLTAQQTISKLRLINADSNLPISGFDPLVDGAVLDLNSLPTRNLNIEAISDPDPVGSVRFSYDATADFRTETIKPYAFFGDNQGSFHAWTPTPGNHTVTATPYTGGGGSGTAGTPLAINFSVIDESLPAPTSGTYIETNGLVVMEAENTQSPLGLWLKKTSISGFTGSGYLDFSGNTPISGPATSPLEYKFKISQPGLYYLHLFCARETVDGRTDVANDCYVRVEGDYTAGPNPGNSHGNDAPLSMLKSDTKFYGGNHNQLVWASGNRLDPGGHTNKRVAIYNFKAGQEYKLVVSGRSQLFKVDRIVFRHESVTSGTAQNKSLPESEKIMIPDHTYAATDDFPTINSGAVTYYKDTARTSLAIDASILANRDKFARAVRSFDGVAGTYAVRITTLVEEDGESTYRLLVNGSVAATYQNPGIGAGSPLDLTPTNHLWSGITLQPGDQIAVESNTHTNGLIPENGGTAWARGRWQSLELYLQAIAPSDGPPPGRVAIVTDGNAHDPDDVCATPVALAMIRAMGVHHRLVHYSHSCELKNKPIFNQAGGAEEQILRQEMNQVSCDGTASRWGGFDHITFWNCRTQWTEAVADLRAALNASTAADPLWIIEAGEPDIIYEAAIGANPGVMRHVHIITHHPNNDIGANYDLDDVLAIQSPGANVVRISDQNINLKTNLSTWYWARDHADARVRWLWERGEYAANSAYGDIKFKFPAIAGKFDCSDAGMTLYWLTGATNGGLQGGTPADIEEMLNNYLDGPTPSTLNSHAGPDQSLVDADGNGSESVILNGSASTAGASPIVSYQWTEAGNPIASGVNPTVLLTIGTHTLTLTITDAAGATHTDTVVITITEPVVPPDNVLFSELSDASPISNGTMGSTANDPAVFSGRAGASPGVNRSPVFVFQLPDLGDVSNPFTTAAFACNLINLNNSTPTANVDLYGLPRRPATTVAASDYFGDSELDSTAAVTRLQDNFVSFSPTPVFPSMPTTNTAGSAALADYLNAQYASGAGANQYVFIRLSNDAAMPNNVRFSFQSANGASAANGGIGDFNVWPQISFSVNPDTDQDSLPDAWEILMFGTVAESPDDDEDGDGSSNLEEYIAGTNPTDGQSRFKVENLSVDALNTVSLTWQSSAERTYTVLKSALLDGGWIPASEPIPGTGGELSFSDSDATGEKSFYKIQVTVP